MPKEQRAVAELITNLILGNRDYTSRVTFFPQKTPFPFEEPYLQPFPRATPESQGISSALLTAMLDELSQAPSVDIHHLMVLRRGKVVCDCSFSPYRQGIWHITHSLCKSITSMAIGLLVEEGKLSLDENIFKIFEGKINPLTKLIRPVITVEDLLTMRSCVSFNESGILSGDDWLERFLLASLTGHPGKDFQYNSLNTYVLSAIVTQRTGETLTQYLTPRLFEPLGITKYLWETSPEGITKGGWGLFLCPEDMAKLGQLYLQKGVWKGQQIIPESWVQASVKKHTDSVPGTFGYGYQIWMEEREDSFEFNGMLGQNVIVYPDLEMVVVTCAGNNELFQNCVMLDIIRSYFTPKYHPEEVLPEHPAAFSLLQRRIRELSLGKQLPYTRARGGWKNHSFRTYGRAFSPKPDLCPTLSLLKKLDGKVYVLSPQNVGLFPLFIQVFHNNLSRGVEEISFTLEGTELAVGFLEGGDWHKLTVGFGQPRDNWLTIQGEAYLTALSGQFAQDENQVPVLKLTLAFLEECTRREIHIFFHEKNIELRWYEFPGKEMILEGLASVTQEMADRFPFHALMDSGKMDLINRLIVQTLEPVTVGLLKEDREADPSPLSSS
ncbi:MAG: serine hydrolase [Eubacteriales bacterium]|nr:serine hydrolase [Eubacteriales bacterium]